MRSNASEHATIGLTISVMPATVEAPLEVATMRKVIVALAVSALLLFLSLAASGCCGETKSVTVVLDNRSDRGVTVVYSVSYLAAMGTTPEGRTVWQVPETHRVVETNTHVSLFTFKMSELGRVTYHVSVLNEDGATICEQRFIHYDVVSHELGSKRSTVTVTVPDCALTKEAKPAASSGKVFGSGCGS